MEIIHGNTSNKIRFILTDTNGARLSGLTYNSAGLIISIICDNEATAINYKQADGNIETIATIGTYVAPTSNKCRFKEVDATNQPGIYEFQFADDRFAVSGAKSIVITVSGYTTLQTQSYEIVLTTKDGYTLTSAYDSAKTAVQAGAKMDIVDAPNSIAITAIQNGLATSANQTTINNNVLAVPAAVWTVTTRTLSSFGSLVSDIATAVWSYVTRTINAESIRTAIGMASANLDDQLDNILSEISSLGIGTAPTEKEYYVYVDSSPCADVLVIMSTDSLGTNKIHRGYTDASGLVTFYPNLATGTTVYMWCYKTGVDFTNPDTEVI